MHNTLPSIISRLEQGQAHLSTTWSSWICFVVHLLKCDDDQACTLTPDYQILGPSSCSSLKMCSHLSVFDSKTKTKEVYLFQQMRAFEWVLLHIIRTPWFPFTMLYHWEKPSTSFMRTLGPGSAKTRSQVIFDSKDQWRICVYLCEQMRCFERLCCISQKGLRSFPTGHDAVSEYSWWRMRFMLNLLNP